MSNELGDPKAAPSRIALSQTAVDENITAAVIGSLVVTDLSLNDAHTLNLVENPSNLFAITGNMLSLAPGKALDFEAASSHVITVRATDASGLTFDQAFTITVNNLGELLSGDAGANAVPASPGPDTVTLGGGADSLRGTLSDLDGDTVTDFSAEDRIVLVGEHISRGNITVTPGSAFIGIDVDGDGRADSTITLQGDFSGGDFMAVTNGMGTTLSFETFLPTLSEGTAQSGENINGIVNQDFLTGDGANTFRVMLDQTQMGALHDNSLGVYEIDAAGNITNVRLLAANVKDSGDGSFDIAGVAAGHQLGFFVAQDSAAWASGLRANDTIGFVDAQGAAATTQSASLQLTVNGTVVLLEVFHSFQASFNGDGVQHVLSGVAPGGESMTIGFDDQVGGGDQDYQGLVFSVTKLAPLQPVSAAPSTAASDISTATGEDSAVVFAPDVLGPLSAQPYTVTLDTAGLSGTATVQLDGTILYDPSGAFNHLQLGGSATERFTYTVTDATGARAQASVEVTVHGLNDAPTPVFETTVGTEDQPLRVFPLANDTDADGSSLKIIALRCVQNGTAEIAADGQSILFTPDPDFDDGVTFEYLVQDDQGGATWGSAEVGFTGLNDAPSVADFAEETEAGRAISFVVGTPVPAGFVDQTNLPPLPWTRLSVTQMPMTTTRSPWTRPACWAW